MRIDRLDLDRFGCFTDCSLDLSAPGIHVIVGLNAAGKTTAMTAIRQLFFGIPVRSPHAFNHELRDLRIGALLRSDGDELLEIVRVKRQADTLRDGSGNVLEESILGRLLHEIDADVFARLFTVGHEEIASGGHKLLTSDGELGRALYSASRGSADINAVLRCLDERAEALFKNAGSNPKVNGAIRGMKEELTRAKELSVSATEVVRLDDALRAARESYETLAGERRRLAQRRTLLQRVKATRPQLATREDCLVRTAAIANLGPHVDPGIGEQLERCRERRNQGQVQRKSAHAAITRLDDELASLSFDSELIDHSEAINALQSEIGAYRQNVTDLPSLVSDSASLARDLDELRLRLPDNFPIDSPGSSSLSADQEARIEELTSRHPKLETVLEEAEDQVSASTVSLEALRNDLDSLDDPLDVESLVETIARVRKAGDLESAHTDAGHRLAQIRSDLTCMVEALGMSAADPRVIDAVAVPSIETIRHYRGELESVRGTVERLEKQIIGIEMERDQVEAELGELVRVEQPPRQEQLPAERARRDEGWRLVRGAWIDGNADTQAIEEWSGDKALPEAYEEAVRQADRVADRLRDEANTVERQASLERRLEETDDQLDTRRGALAEARNAHNDAEATWTKVWEPFGVLPGSPEEMEDWRDRFRSCSEQAIEARRLVAESRRHSDTIARHRTDLVLALRSVGAEADEELSLAGLLDHADQVVAKAITACQVYVGLKTSISNAESLHRGRTKSRDKHQAAMQTWKQSWTDAVKSIGLPVTASPAEAKAVLKTLSEANTTTGKLASLKRRVTGIEGRNRQFVEGVEGLLGKIGGHADLAGSSPDVAIATLSRRLDEAQAVAAEHRAASLDRENQEQDRIAVALVVTDAEEQISRMVDETGVADEGELDRTVTRSVEYAELVVRIEKLEEDLRQATGLSLIEIEAEAASLSGSEIEPEVDELDREIDALDERIKNQGRAVGELENRRSSVDTSGQAAEATARAQNSLADMASYAEEYVQVVLAKRLLEEQVAAYREQHQGPLLARARDLFRSLTLDQFHGLDTDIDEKGNPYLLARSSKDKLIDVSGLSSGERDQLYLALRLAALEQYMERRVALPLVLDDLFVHFDDPRTAAGLEILDQLADRTQVLLFSHHEQVAKQAAQVIKADRLTVHRLGAPKLYLETVVA